MKRSKQLADERPPKLENLSSVYARVTEQDRRGELKDQVDLYIRRQLFEQRTLQCGDQVNEREIARVLGISRAPVREALKTLEEQGLLVSVKYRGWFIADFLKEDVYEINKLRTLLEYNLLESILSSGGLSQEELSELNQLNRELETVIRSDLPSAKKSFEFTEGEMTFHLFMYSLAEGSCFWTKKILKNLSSQVRCALHKWIYEEAQMWQAVAAHDRLIRHLADKDIENMRRFLFHRLENGPLSTAIKNESEPLLGRELF